MRFANRISACRRELNSHGAAKPRRQSTVRQRVREQALHESERMEQRHLQVARANRTDSNTNDLEPPRHIEPSHCVEGSGFQSVRWAAEDGVVASCKNRSRRLEYTVRQGLRCTAGGVRGGSQGIAGPLRAWRSGSKCAALPNPSLKGSANSRPPGPPAGLPHFPSVGPGVLLPAPP